MKLEEFKDLLSIADYKMCESKMEKTPTWYPLTIDVFVKFLYKVFFSLFSSNFHVFWSCLVPNPFMFILEGDIQRGGYRGKVVP